jgi:PadR family transcriptional regulator PadR
MRTMTITTVSVLGAIASGLRYGFDITDATGLESGTVYPVLSRLERDGFVESTWENETAAHTEGRPARRYYRITKAGRAALDVATAHYRTLVPSLARARRARG